MFGNIEVLDLYAKRMKKGKNLSTRNSITLKPGKSVITKVDATISRSITKSCEKFKSVTFELTEK